MGIILQLCQNCNQEKFCSNFVMPGGWERLVIQEGGTYHGGVGNLSRRGGGGKPITMGGFSIRTSIAVTTVRNL